MPNAAAFEDSAPVRLTHVIHGRKGKIMQEKKGETFLPGVGITEEDVYAAMKSVPGYIDITPGDFKELYCIAYSHAQKRFAASISAKDIMARRVVHVSPDTPMADIAEILSSSGVSGVPVVDPDLKVLGVLSEKDIFAQLASGETGNFMGIIARCLRAKGCVALPVKGLTAREIMTSPAVTVREHTTLLEILEVLAENTINRLPVIDSEGRLVGMVARNDVLNAALRSGTCHYDTSGK